MYTYQGVHKDDSSVTEINPASTKTFREREVFLWKVFLTFSERLFGLFPHNHQKTFTEHLTYDHPSFAFHSSSCRPSSILYTPFCFMLCVEQCFTCNLHIPCEKRSQNVPSYCKL